MIDQTYTLEPIRKQGATPIEQYWELDRVINNIQYVDDPERKEALLRPLEAERREVFQALAKTPLECTHDVIRQLERVFAIHGDTLAPDIRDVLEAVKDFASELMGRKDSAALDALRGIDEPMRTLRARLMHIPAWSAYLSEDGNTFTDDHVEALAVLVDDIEADIEAISDAHSAAWNALTNRVEVKQAA